MAMVTYEPLNAMSRLRDQLNKVFEMDFPSNLWDGEGSIVTSRWTPMVDIKEENDRFIFLADIPGVDRKDIEITADNGALTIKGERKTESKEEREGYRRVERSYGSFYRRFNLPDTANTDKIHARTKDGVLEIEIPKLEKAKPHRIEITN